MKPSPLYFLCMLTPLLVRSEPVAIAPIVEETTGRLISTAVEIPGADCFLLLKGAYQQRNYLIGSQTGQDLEFVSVHNANMRLDAVANNATLCFPERRIDGWLKPPDDAPSEGAFLWFFTDNSGSTLPKPTFISIELSDTVIRRLEHFPAKIPASEEISTGGVVYYNGRLIGVLFPSARNPSIFPVKALENVKEELASADGRRSLVRNYIDSVSWIDGEPTYDSPKKKFRIHLNTLPFTEDFELVASYNIRSDREDRALPLTRLDDRIFESAIDMTALRDQYSNVKVSFHSRDDEYQLHGYTQDRLIPTADKPVLLSRIIEQVSSRRIGQESRGPIHLFSKIQALIDVATQEPIANLSQFESISIIRSSETIHIDVKVAAVLSGKKQYPKKLSFDYKLGDSYQSAEDVDTSLKLSRWIYTYDLPKNDFRKTGDGKYAIYVNKSSRIEIFDLKRLVVRGEIDTSTLPDVAENFVSDNDFIYLLKPDKKAIVVYSIPSGRFVKTIGLSQLGFDQDDRFFDIGASPLGRGDFTAVVTLNEAHTRSVLRIDVRGPALIFKKDLPRNQTGLLLGRMVSPLFNVDGFPFFRAKLVEASPDEKPFDPPAGSFDDIDWHDSFRYRRQSISTAVLRADYPTLSIRGGFVRALQLNIYSHSAFEHMAAQMVESRGRQSYLFVNEPVYFRTADGKLDAPLPVYSSSDDISLKLLSGRSEYALTEDRRLIYNGELTADYRPDFILIEARIPLGEKMLFWVAVDNF